MTRELAIHIMVNCQTLPPSMVWAAWYMLNPHLKQPAGKLVAYKEPRR